VLRAGVGIGLAAFLVRHTLKSTGTDILGTLRAANLPLVLLALAIHGLVVLTTMVRWHLLMKVQDISVRFADVVRLTMIGQLFNLAIPGAVGGDVAKMAFITRQTAGKKTEAVFTILVDRIVGVFGLFLVAGVMVLFSLRFLIELGAENRALQAAAFVVGGGSIAGVVGIVLVEMHQSLLKLPGMPALLAFGEAKLPHRIVDTVKRMTAAVDLFRRGRATLGLAVVLSVCVHALLAVDLFVIGKALGDTALRLPHYFLASPVANAIAAVPLTPAGFGLRDATTQVFLSAMAETDLAGVIPVGLTFCILFWGLTGALVFVIGSPVREAEIEAEICSTE